MRKSGKRNISWQIKHVLRPIGLQERNMVAKAIIGFAQLFGVLGFILIMMGFVGHSIRQYEEVAADFMKAGGLSFLVAIFVVCVGLVAAYTKSKLSNDK